MSAGTYNLVIDQGSDFAIQLTISEEGVAKNLTGYSARAQLRPTKKSTTLSATFTCTITNAAQGILKMELENAVTATLLDGIYFYDLELFSSNDEIVSRLLEGQATVTPEVTR
jgi:hypothetical protein